MLFSRLPASLRLQATKRLAQFLDTTFLNNNAEVAHMCSEIGRLAPLDCIHYLLEPVLGKIEKEDLALIDPESSKDIQLSKVGFYGSPCKVI